MVQITIGYVAGAIAAAIFAARIWSPNAITFILSGILRDKNSAATWTAASAALQKSHWPWVLQSDSAQNPGVRKDILVLTWFITLMSFLIALAGIVTPLGLHETLAMGNSIYTPFEYLPDTSSFGFGTPPRSDLPLNRFCAMPNLKIPCPFTKTEVVVKMDANWINSTYPFGYDIMIPETLRKAYASGTGYNSTIANYFDIEYRRYQIKLDKEDLDHINNDSAYLVGANRVMQSLVLNDKIEPVEGLLVDSKKGSIAFRNHTVPVGFEHGVTWDEDLLFVEPETACVNTNITLDFEILASVNDTYAFAKPVLTDRGGFANLIQEWPLVDLTNTQANPRLRERAYKAAWITNFYTMLYYNITNPVNATSKQKSFAYVNSEVGSTYFVPNNDNVGQIYDTLSLTSKWEKHLFLTAQYTDGSGDRNHTFKEIDLPFPTNPFSITSRNFTDINLLCSGVGSDDKANITNIFVKCGLMRSVPKRIDPGSSMLFDAGSKWSQQIYACASAVKATVKTTSFTYNGTGISSLKVDKVEPKIYPDKLPLWGVENTGNRLNTSQIELLWGLVADRYENHPNISTVRQESLYLPGTGFLTFAGLTLMSNQNLPASEFYQEGLSSAYGVTADTSTSARLADYSGSTSMALWAKWQVLSANETIAATIPNLIWADYAAASVVGTRGVRGWRNLSPSNTIQLPVFPTEKRIRYHFAFAIPAILAFLGLILMTIGVLLTVVFKHHNIAALRHQLQKLSPGRIFTTFLHPELGGMTVASKEWSKTTGKTVIDVTGEYPQSAGLAIAIAPIGIVNEEERKGLTPTVFDTSASDISTERDRFLGQHPLPIPEPYLGTQGQHRSSVSPVTPTGSPGMFGRNV